MAAIDRHAALRGTRRLHVPRGTVPLGPCLVLQPAGGYPPQPPHACIPLGVTGVVSGERNAAIVAEQALEVLLIEADHYLAAWFRPYGLHGPQQRLALRSRQSP